MSSDSSHEVMHCISRFMLWGLHPTDRTFNCFDRHFTALAKMSIGKAGDRTQYKGNRYCSRAHVVDKRHIHHGSKDAILDLISYIIAAQPLKEFQIEVLRLHKSRPYTPRVQLHVSSPLFRAVRLTDKGTPLHPGSLQPISNIPLSACRE